MGAQHTPGPWRFDDDGEVRAYGTDDEFGDELLDNIAVVYGEENGPLIAAAPDLLEALIAIHDREWADGNLAEGHRHAAEMWRIADETLAAIAKARGGVA